MKDNVNVNQWHDSEINTANADIIHYFTLFFLLDNHKCMCGSVLVCLNMCATSLTLACHSNSQQLLSAVRAHTRIKSIYIYFFSAVFAFATLHMEQKYEKRNKINFLLCKCSFLYFLYFLRTFMLLPVTNLP